MRDLCLPILEHAGNKEAGLARPGYPIIIVPRP
jgi:hypothetical protein